ncbi:phosphatase PAP2 family protein [Canibacter sp. lx-45]|uniref:phosphatase PAP2 family protein n=1 Tax=Canibacter zhuwentaonis TaxID=2837491 RepID=UPI001BDD7748|nr:phosphatase PAP2 family protein [Canibacter zhuwentaonis]MBT1035008.1 phosphatase PAP2 family protein [Canibacter zhuwentaonis]
MSDRTHRARWKSFFITVFACALGVLAFVFGVQSTTGQFAEAKALAASTLNYHPGPPLSLLSPAFVFVTVAILVLLAAALWGFGRAVVIGSASFVAVVVSQLLKLVVLERPSLWEFDAHNTFPSGHMTAFTVLALGVIMVVPKHVRAIMSVCMAALLCYVAMQLLSAGWHRPSDVIGGSMLALASYGVFFVLLPPNKKTGGPGESLVSWLLSMLTLVLIAAGTICAAIAWFGADDSKVLVSAVLYAAAVAVISCRAGLALARG